MCQSQNGDHSIARQYFAEGEYLPSQQASIYYGPDQLGSVRDAYATSPLFNIPQAYDYDPTGNPLVVPTQGPLTDFRYAHMFYHGDSGLYLTEHRAYDPRTGRWLSRDPLGEASDPAANLYRYVNGNSISLVDPAGRWGIGGIGSATAEAGAGLAGVGGSASTGAGFFWGGSAGPNAGSFGSFGGFAGRPGYGAQYPNCPLPSNGPAVAGGLAGAGRGLFLTDADSAGDLAGAFDTYSANFGPISAQFGFSGSTWIESVTAGPGAGARFSSYPTYTVPGP